VPVLLPAKPRGNDIVTDQPDSGDQPSISARAQEVTWVTGTPLRGAPAQTAAPMPTAEAVTAATESAAALRAGLVAEPEKSGLARLVDRLLGRGR
jgi:hypothetical protein